jgi:hypothetical protein
MNLTKGFHRFRAWVGVQRVQADSVTNRRDRSMKIFLPMCLSFFACVIGIHFADHIFGGKPDEPFALAVALLIAISIGIESAVSIIKKEFGLDVKDAA